MSAQQQNFFDTALYAIKGVKPVKKRIRYKTPTYIKKYQLKRFNEETQEFFYDSDEKHIYRYAVLQRIHSIIYDYCGINPFEHFEIKEIDGLICHKKDMQAEIKNTWRLPLGERLKLHIKLLRYLKRGYTISESLKKISTSNERGINA